MKGVSEGRKDHGNSVWAREWAQGPRRERQGTSDREPLGQASFAGAFVVPSVP